jgi:hypothetical protein
MQQVVQSSIQGMSSGLQTTIDERGTAVVMCSTDPANRLEISLTVHNQNVPGLAFQTSKDTPLSNDVPDLSFQTSKDMPKIRVVFFF